MNFANEYDANLVINGGVFDENYSNKSDLVLNGVLNYNGVYSNKGLIFESNSIKLYTTSASIGQPFNFIGGSPTIIQKGIRTIDFNGFLPADYKTLKHRMSLGVDDNNLFIITTGQENTYNLYTLIDEGLAQGVKTLTSLNSGEAVAQAINKKMAIAGTINTPTAICFKIKWS